MAKKQPEMTREQWEISRVRLPRKGEVLGLVEMMLGGDRMRVQCDDGHVRICRIPGRLRKRVWIKPGNLVLVRPWELQTNERGDIIYRYTPTQANWMKRRGHLKLISF